MAQFKKKNSSFISNPSYVGFHPLSGLQSGITPMIKSNITPMIGVQPIQKKGKQEADQTAQKESTAAVTQKKDKDVLHKVGEMGNVDMSDTRIHYNGSEPERYNTEAIAQAPHIHLTPGKEKHLGHEAWHIAQQKQGRVKFTDPDGNIPDRPSPPDIFYNVTTKDNYGSSTSRERTYSATMTLKIVNLVGADLSGAIQSEARSSTDAKIERRNYMGWSGKRLKHPFNGQGMFEYEQEEQSVLEITNVDLDIRYEIVNSLNEIEENDHVVLVVGNIANKDGGNTIGKAEPSGSIAAVEAGTLKTPGQFHNTMIHEIGHLLGLRDLYPTSSSQKDNCNCPERLMYNSDGESLTTEERGKIGIAGITGLGVHTPDGKGKKSDNVDKTHSKEAAKEFIRRTGITY